MDIVQKAIDYAGFECIEAEWNQHDELLRLYIDHPSGIDMESCAKVSKILNELDLIDDLKIDDINLEVSSPGVERPLRRISNFTDSIGKEIAIRFSKSIGGNKSIQGVLVHVDTQTVELNSHNERYIVPLENVHKANLVYNWDL